MTRTGRGPHTFASALLLAAHVFAMVLLPLAHRDDDGARVADHVEQPGGHAGHHDTACPSCRILDGRPLDVPLQPSVLAAYTSPDREVSRAAGAHPLRDVLSRSAPRGPPS